MKFLLLLLPALAWGQITQTQCNIISGQNGVVAASSTTRYVFDNRRNNCQVWQASWFAIPGTGISSVEIDFTEDQGGTSGGPGTWAAFANTPTTGPNPTFNSVSGLITVSGYHPWISILITCSFTGGSVNFFLHGTNNSPQQALSVSGNSSAPISAFNGSATSGVIANSGQTAHQLTASLANVTGQTCAATDFYTVTFTGTTLTGGASTTMITLEVHQAGGVANGYATGFYGIYSVFATAGGSAATTCSLTVTYQGFPYVGFMAATSNSYYGPNGVTSAGAVDIHPVSECSRFNLVNLLAATSTALLTPVLSGTTKICELVVTATAAATFSFGVQAAASNCTAFTNSGSFTLATGTPLKIGGSLGTVITVPKNDNFCLLSSVAASGYISWDVF